MRSRGEVGGFAVSSLFNRLPVISFRLGRSAVRQPPIRRTWARNAGGGGTAGTPKATEHSILNSEIQKENGRRFAARHGLRAGQSVLEESDEPRDLEAKADSLRVGGGGGDASRRLERLEEFDEPGRRLQLGGKQRFGARPKLRPQLRRRNAPYRLLDHGENLGLLVAQALRPQLDWGRRAEFREQALVRRASLESRCRPARRRNRR